MISALLILSFLIFFHEFGHFLMAKLVGVKVEVFSIGFGKKLFCKKIGETNWCISAVPLGGYVQMKG
jgi:regulator of sigma E protease